MKAEFGPQGLVIVAPTQKYGYVASGEEARPRWSCATSSRSGASVLRSIISTPAPVSEENFRRYGASTTPTLVLIDRNGHRAPVSSRRDDV